MANLVQNSKIKEFLLGFPENQHENCLLGLCLLGIETVKSKKLNFMQYIIENVESSDLYKLRTKIRGFKKELLHTNISMITENESLPTNVSVTSIQETTEKKIENEQDFTPKKEIRPDRKQKNDSSVIDVVENFLSTGLIREIYEKEMITDRLKVPFRQKWDNACKNVSSDDKIN